MKYLVFLFTFLYSLLSFGGETFWDLDSVISRLQTTQEANDQTQGIWTRDYVLKLDDIRKKISRQSGIYPKFLISSNTDINA
jgi:hypothetical protein